MIIGDSLLFHLLGGLFGFMNGFIWALMILDLLNAFSFQQLVADQPWRKPFLIPNARLCRKRYFLVPLSTFSFAFDSHVFGNQKQINGV